MLKDMLLTLIVCAVITVVLQAGFYILEKNAEMFFGSIEKGITEMSISAISEIKDDAIIEIQNDLNDGIISKDAGEYLNHLVSLTTETFETSISNLVSNKLCITNGEMISTWVFNKSKFKAEMIQLTRDEIKEYDKNVTEIIDSLKLPHYRRIIGGLNEFEK